MSEGQETLSSNEFLYCYRPVQVPKVKGIYYFKCRKEERNLVTKVPSSNRDWKRKIFFVNGLNWVYSLEEVGGVQPIDCTWGCYLSLVNHQSSLLVYFLFLEYYLTCLWLILSSNFTEVVYSSVS